MKKFLVLTALTLISSSAFAVDFDCVNAKTGRAAGRIAFESNRIDYFSTRTSNEGWYLIVHDGIVWNYDISVQGGREFEVAKIEAVTGGFKLLSFAGRGDLICR